MSKKSPHATGSFASLVAQEGNRQFKDNIEPLIREYVGHLGEILQKNLATAQMRTLAELRTRLSALERLLLSKGLLSDSEISETILDVEDEVWGLNKGEEAQKGDFLRVSFRQKKAGQVDFDLPRNINVSELGSGHNLPLSVEETLLGTKAGEKRTATSETPKMSLDGKVMEEKETTEWEVSVVRVSRKKVQDVKQG